MALRITNAAEDRPVIWLYGDIGGFFGGITPDDFRKALESIPAKKEIDLHINSDGGIFFDGVAMYSLLRQRKAPVRVVVDGIAASAASIVAMGGTTISMASHSWMMIHEARSGGEGTAEELRKEADRLEAINSEIVSIYAKRWTGTEKELVSAMNVESWYTAEQCIDLGLADEVIEQMAVAAHVDPSKFSYHNVPQPLVAKSEPTFDRLTERAAIFSELVGQEEHEKCA